jgi:hypothetical protein
MNILPFNYLISTTQTARLIIQTNLILIPSVTVMGVQSHQKILDKNSVINSLHLLAVDRLTSISKFKRCFHSLEALIFLVRSPKVLLFSTFSKIPRKLKNLVLFLK